jgi:hypothetical protein
VTKPAASAFAVLACACAAARAAEPAPLWHYGAAVDAGYIADLNHPDNHVWRSKGTDYDVGQTALNMALGYVRKDAAESSRWGLELSGQGGRDANIFGFSNTSPNLDHGDALRHLGRANVSYLAPVGRGLTIQAGLFNSLVGEESLYAKDNLNYTRSWIADYSPYQMFGGNVSYPFTDATTATAFVVNEYFHLSRSNAEPAYGLQVAHKAAPDLALKQSVMYGPDQPQTSIGFWRLFSDTIVEYKKGELTAWLDHQVGTERVSAQGDRRIFWDGAAAAGRWAFTDRLSAAERWGYFWDHDGRMTGARQFIREVTTTFEYRLPWRRTATALRLEHRWDSSTGPDGGFFYGKDSSSASPTLRAQQHKLIAALLWTFDSP